MSSAVFEKWGGGEKENADPVQVGDGLQNERTGQSIGAGEDIGGGGDDGIWGRPLRMDQGRMSLSQHCLHYCSLTGGIRLEDLLGRSDLDSVVPPN